MMGIQGFTSKDKYTEMTKELSRTQAKDCKAEKESSDTADQLRLLFSGLSTSQITLTFRSGYEAFQVSLGPF